MPEKRDSTEVRKRLQEIRSERAIIENRWTVLQKEETELLKYLRSKKEKLVESI